MIGIIVGPPATGIPSWRAERNATHPNVVHEPAPFWLGPLCNLGVNPMKRLIVGAEVHEHRITCAYCKELRAGEAGPWTQYYQRKTGGAR